jgi:glycerate dehydrogenase
MKIVVLDGYPLNPGDLSWAGLKALGEVTVHDRTPGDLILERAAGAEMLLTNKTPLSADTLEQLPDLQYIGLLATGYNVVDVAAAAARNIIVTNVPTYGTQSVAQMVFAHLLALCHRVELHSYAVKAGKWAASPDFCFWESPQIELAGKTIGIIGFGRIGHQVGRIAAAFGMNVQAYDARQWDVTDIDSFKWAALDDLFATSDVVSLNCPLFPETEGMINAENLKKMKASAFLINASRGGLVIEQDLADALNRGDIAGAALDVLSTEPPARDNPLFWAKNVLITPHIAWATQEARQRLMNTVVQNVSAFLAGESQNVVKPND